MAPPHIPFYGPPWGYCKEGFDSQAQPGTQGTSHLSVELKHLGQQHSSFISLELSCLGNRYGLALKRETTACKRSPL